MLFLSILLSGTLLAACVTTGIPGMKVISSQEGEETYLHEFSKFVFPKLVESFNRVKIHSFDRDGHDIGIGYNSRSGINLTIYVYPLQQANARGGDDVLENHFQDVKGVTLRAHPGAQLVSVGPIVMEQNGKSYLGRKAILTVEDIVRSGSFFYELGLTGIASRGISELYVFRLNQYFIKYRVTYVDSISDKAKSEVPSFMRALHWPLGIN